VLAWHVWQMRGEVGEPGLEGTGGHEGKGEFLVVSGNGVRRVKPYPSVLASAGEAWPTEASILWPFGRRWLWLLGPWSSGWAESCKPDLKRPGRLGSWLHSRAALALQ